MRHYLKKLGASNYNQVACFFDLSSYFPELEYKTLLWQHPNRKFLDIDLLMEDIRKIFNHYIQFDYTEDGHTIIFTIHAEDKNVLKLFMPLLRTISYEKIGYAGGYDDNSIVGSSYLVTHLIKCFRTEKFSYSHHGIYDLFSYLKEFDLHMEDVVLPICEEIVRTLRYWFSTETELPDIVSEKATPILCELIEEMKNAENSNK